MACDLLVSNITPTNPTTVGGYGFVTFAYSTADVRGVGVNAVGPVTRALNFPFDAGTAQLSDLPAGNYYWVVALTSDGSCSQEGHFTIADPLPAIDDSLTDAPKWEPVGGVLPNPVLLKVETTLLTAGAARAGLHVEVELWRPDAAAAFATFRATVHTATQYVDAVPYLRAELVALQRYAATSSNPLIDQDASLRFYYKIPGSGPHRA
jgi:hypothetical protein